jgi:Fe2+ or Zn2+ uptake regulation protein
MDQLIAHPVILHTTNTNPAQAKIKEVRNKLQENAPDAALPTVYF